jgi:outer membrane protein assembly factor BamB
MVVVGSEDFKVYCIDNISGKTTSRWIYATLDRVKSSACFNKESENLIIGSNDFNLYAINHVNGQLRWKFPTSSIINTSPVDYNGNVVFSCMDKYCYCVNASTGKLVWKYNINSVADASPMVCTIAGTNYYPAECFNSIY